MAKNKAIMRARAGKMGENLAVRFLMKHGYQVIQRNYRRKCGEIDIVAIKDGIYSFFEVKAVVSREMMGEMPGRGSDKVGYLRRNVNHETYRPEFNLHTRKIAKVVRTAHMFLVEQGKSGQVFCVHALCITLFMKQMRAKVCFIRNIA